MRSARNFCTPPKVLCVPPEISAFPQKCSAFPQEFMHSPESPMCSPGKPSTLGSSRTAAGINTLFAAEAVFGDLVQRLVGRDFRRGKIRMAGRIGIMLGLDADGVVVPVDMALIAVNGVRDIVRIELEGRLGG